MLGPNVVVVVVVTVTRGRLSVLTPTTNRSATTRVTAIATGGMGINSIAFADAVLRCKCQGGPPAGKWCQQNTGEDKDKETCARLSPCILSTIYADRDDVDESVKVKC